MKIMSTVGRGAVLGVALLLGAVIASCSDNPVTGGLIGTVSGQVQIVGTSTGVPGAVLTLTGPNVNLQATTPANGGFLFEDLPFGDFTLVLTPPAGWEMAQGSSATRTIGMAGGNASFHFSLVQSGGS